MSVTFEQFFSAIAKQESDGRYSAVGVQVNGDRAYGKYQVMGANIPSWTRKYYGRSLSPQQYLNNQAAQDAVARGVLKSYFGKYGARGAASAWYSGNPNLSESTSSQPGGPSIKGYVDSVMNIASGYPATGSSSSSIGAIVTPKIDPQTLAEQYGFASALLNSNPELKTLFSRAVSGSWSPDKFQAELRGTKWWKTHTSTERQYLLQVKSDPATARQSLSQATSHVNQLASQLGVNPAQAKGALSAAAYNVAAKGWTDEQLRSYLGQYVAFLDPHGKAQASGEGGTDMDELKAYSYSMGVVPGDGKWYADNVRKILMGKSSLEDIKSQIRTKAKAQYSQWGKQIDGGQTVMDLAQPYMQSMSQILELPQGSVSLTDPTVKKAMTYIGKSTNNEAGAGMPLWQFQNQLRSDPRWKQTQNAQDSLMQVGHQVLQDFGLKT